MYRTYSLHLETLKTLKKQPLTIHLSKLNTLPSPKCQHYPKTLTSSPPKRTSRPRLQVKRVNNLHSSSQFKQRRKHRSIQRNTPTGLGQMCSGGWMSAFWRLSGFRCTCKIQVRGGLEMGEGFVWECMFIFISGKQKRLRCEGRSEWRCWVMRRICWWVAQEQLTKPYYKTLWEESKPLWVKNSEWMLIELCGRWTDLTGLVQMEYFLREGEGCSYSEEYLAGGTENGEEPNLCLKLFLVCWGCTAEFYSPLATRSTRYSQLGLSKSIGPSRN